MTQTDFEDPGNDLRSQALIDVVEDFLRVFEDRIEETNPGRQNDVLIRRVFQGTPLGGELVGQQPERFIVDYLVGPILSTLGYEYRPEPCGLNGLGNRRPDFVITNTSELTIIGEVKTPNEIRSAQKESFEYLLELDSRIAAAISTDGLTWNLHWAVGDELPKRQGHHHMKTAMNMIRKDPENYRTVRKTLYPFVETFQRRSLLETANEYGSTLEAY